MQIHYYVLSMAQGNIRECCFDRVQRPILIRLFSILSCQLHGKIIGAFHFFVVNNYKRGSSLVGVPLRVMNESVGSEIMNPFSDSCQKHTLSLFPENIGKKYLAENSFTLVLDKETLLHWLTALKNVLQTRVNIHQVLLGFLERLLYGVEFI